MFYQKMWYFLFITAATVVIVGLSTLFVMEGDGFITQAQNNTQPFLPVSQSDTLVLGQSQWVTDTFNLDEEVIFAGTQVIALKDLDNMGGNGIIGTLSNDAVAFVSPASFHQASNSPTTSSPADGFRFWPEAGYIYNTSSTTITLIAPVYLPDGATLTKFSMVLFDNDPTYDPTAILYRKNLVSSPASSYAEAIIGVSYPITDSQQVFEVFNSTFSGSTTVSNEYGYYVTLEFAPNTGINQLALGFSVAYSPPVSASSGVEIMPLAAFRHNGNNADDARFSFLSGFVQNTSTNEICLVAPTYPPNGTTLTQFGGSIADADDTSNLAVYLWRTELDTGTVSQLAVITSTGTSGSPNNGEISSPSFSSVVSTSYGYRVTLCFNPNTNGNIRFFGTRLFYTE